jgi:hypothetical protein
MVKGKKKKEKKPIKTGASSGHITNLKQSILETFNICAFNKPTAEVHFISIAKQKRF